MRLQAARLRMVIVTITTVSLVAQPYRLMLSRVPFGCWLLQLRWGMAAASAAGR